MPGKFCGLPLQAEWGKQPMSAALLLYGFEAAKMKAEWKIPGSQRDGGAYF